MKNKKLSVVIPVYNSEKYLESCLESILISTFDEKLVEIILVDDGSTDGSSDICDYYAKRYSFIVTYHIANGGQSNARNYALEHAKGKWIAYVDCDDLVVNDYISTVLSLVEKLNDNDILMFRFKKFSEYRESEIASKHNLEKVRKISKGEAMYDLTLKTWDNFLWNKIWPKKIIDRVALPVGKIFEDMSTVYQYFEIADNIFIYDKVLYLYRLNEFSSIHNKNLAFRYKSIKEVVNARREQILFFEKKGYVSAKLNAINNLVYDAISLIMYTETYNYVRGEEYRYSKSMVKSYTPHIKENGIKIWLLVKFYSYLPKVFKLCSKIYFKKKFS